MKKLFDVIATVMLVGKPSLTMPKGTYYSENHLLYACQQKFGRQSGTIRYSEDGVETIELELNRELTSTELAEVQKLIANATSSSLAFAQAVEAAAAGKVVRRASWPNGKSVSYFDSTELKAGMYVLESLTPTEEIYTPSPDDAVASDWEVL